MITPLDKFNPTLTHSMVSKNLLLNQLQQFYQKKANSEGGQIASRIQGRINANNIEGDKWRDLKSDLDEVGSHLSRTIGRINAIRQRLDTMILTVQNADADSEVDNSPEGYASSFDSLLNGLRAMAERGKYSPNLIGDNDYRRLTYEVSIYGATRSVLGSYLGSDYYIIDSNENRWEPDHSLKQLRQYADFPEDPTGLIGNLQEGVKLDSLSGSDITFTTGTGTANEVAYTGTLYSKGLDVLDAWLYDGLGTADGRARALEDLQAAKLTIDLELQHYKTASTSVEFYQKRADLSVDAVQSTNDDLLLQQASELGKIQNRLQRQYQAAAANIEMSVRLQERYSSFLMSTEDNKLISALISVNA